MQGWGTTMAKAKKPKRKNPGVGVDFSRVKQKVGKKLAPAANETNTQVRARTINLPSQSLAADKSGSAVTHRNLTLKVMVPARSVWICPLRSQKNEMM